MIGDGSFRDVDGAFAGCLDQVAALAVELSDLVNGYGRAKPAAPRELNRISQEA